jgi:hypothetical protein
MIVLTDAQRFEDAVAALNTDISYWFAKSGLDPEALLEQVVNFAQVIPTSEMGRILAKMRA